jgi:glycosyltransferase involved in cell wall biosynthesis
VSRAQNNSFDQTHKIRVAHLVSHPIQYFAPVYRALASRPEIDLTVYFYSGVSLREYLDGEFGRTIKWDVPLVAGYDFYLNEKDVNRRIPLGFDRKPNWSILKKIAKGKHDVLWLHGYASVNACIALTLSRLKAVPILLRDEQTLLTPRSRLNSALKRLLLPIIFRNIHGLYLGQNNRSFFEKYGAKKLFNFRYCVDNEYLRKRHDELRPNRVEIRKRFGIQDCHPTVLFSGKLIDKKQPHLLLEAFRRVREHTKCHLLFVGDGHLHGSLTEMVVSQGIPDVHFAGFLNQTELPAAYTVADVLVLPSAYQETWGMVVNEAMNFGLPVIVSDRVGCVGDLVKPGENGYVFQSGNVPELVAALTGIVTSQDRRLEFGKRSSEIIAGYSIEASASQIVDACVRVAHRKSRDLAAIATEPSPQ